MDSARDLLNSNIGILLAMLSFMWGIHSCDVYIFDRKIKNRCALKPKTTFDPLSFLMQGFVHGDWNHLYGNSKDFFVFGLLVMLPDVNHFFIATPIILLINGWGILYFGHPPRHIGASGLVYGYVGVIIFRGYFLGRPDHLVLGLLFVIVYFRFLRGLTILIPGISYVSHFFGFVGGIAAARVVSLVV